MGTIGRWFSGESAALTVFSAQGQPGEVGFVTKVPGRIVPVPIRPGRGMIVQASGYLCGEEGVDVKLHFQKKILGGLFGGGGEGLLLTTLRGPGKVWLQTLPFPYLVAGVAAAMPGSQGASGVGSLIGELIDRA